MQNQPTEQASLIESTAFKGPLKDSGKLKPEASESTDGLVAVVHLGIASDGDMQLCLFPAFTEAYDDKGDRLEAFLKKTVESGPLKTLATKNKLKLGKGGHSMALPRTINWWTSDPRPERAQTDIPFKLSRPLGDRSLVATNVSVIDNKKGGSKSILEIARLLKENHFLLSAPLEDFLRICEDIENKIKTSKESGHFFYFSEIEKHNLNSALKNYNGEPNVNLRKLGWRSTFKFFSELSERSQDLIFFDPAKNRPGSFQDLSKKYAERKLEDLREDHEWSQDLTHKVLGPLPHDRAPLDQDVILKVPDIGYLDFEILSSSLIGPFVECRLFKVNDFTLAKRLMGTPIDAFYAQNEKSPYMKVRDFLWRLLLGSSETFVAKSVSQYDRALAVKNGLKNKSAYIHYLEFFPTKSLDENGFLVTSPTSSGLSQIDFAVPDPEFASSTQIQKEKHKAKGLPQPVLSLKDFLKSSQETHSPSVIHDSYFWPQGRIYQFLHLTSAMLTMPKLGTTAEFLFEDQVGISSDVKSIMGNEETVQRIPELSLTESYSQLSGLYPKHFSHEHESPYTDRYLEKRPQTLLHIHDLGVKEQISINVRYSNSDGLAIEQCLEALKRDFSASQKTDAQGSKSKASLKSDTPQNSHADATSAEPTLAINQYDSILEKLRDLLQFEAIPYFMINGAEVSESEWFQAKKSPSGVYEVAPGQFVPESTYSSYTENYYLKKKALAKMGRIPMQKVWTSHLNFINGSDEDISPDAYLQSLKLSISKEFDKLDEILKGTSAKDWIRNHLPVLESSLREYQAQGIMWIKSRLAMNYGVCLADEMGLGKTLQAIGVLMLFKNPKLPSLVLVPKSLLMNWKNELERFAPELKVKMIEDESSFDDSEIYLMSYGAMRHKAPLITKRHWNLAILDEAQSIKNSQSLTAQIALELTCTYRLALTGTPVENHASELWSIINWLNPQYLGSVSSFEKYTKHARIPEKRPYYLAPLRECLKPIMLRRLKNDPQVALGLPEKVSQDLRFELSETQCLLYKSVIDVVLNSHTVHHFARMAQYLRSIHFLKQICIHPSLFLDDVTADEALETSELNKSVKKNALKLLKTYEKPKTSADIFKDSAKLAQLYEVLETERTSSNGILIFTQYLKAADLMMILLKDLGYAAVPFINGSLTANRRQEIVDQFNKQASVREPGQLCPILICSLKAGGTGLNLTGADRVIHLDRWWNPAVENQATDRAHRFGQTRTVFVNTLTNDGTLEDSMNRIFEEKRRLAQDLLSDEDVALAECLKDESGYLNLVDPKQLFYKK
ncbi:MAG: DEAD/DEAH box helicase [Pseudomonadota bacterium]